MSRRLRVALAVALWAIGVGMVVAAYSSGGTPEVHTGPVAPVPRHAADPGSRLEPSAPRSSAGTPGGTDSPGRPPRAARAEPLPPQWPEFRPTRLLLQPEGTPAAVDPVSVTGRALDLPADPDRVGWWRGGSRAGTPFGSVVVAGHLDSATDPAGYLAGLATLAPGDVVELSAPGERQRYRVVRNVLVPSADLSGRSDLFGQQQRHRLVLITCGGPYDHVAGRYRDNRVVEAVPVG